MDRNGRPKRYSARRLIALAALALAGCFHTTDPAPIDPGPDPNPPVVLGSCDRMCKHLRDLGCKEGGKTQGRDGVPDTGDETTCEAICENAEREGQSVSPGCLEKVPSCAAIADC